MNTTAGDSLQNRTAASPGSADTAAPTANGGEQQELGRLFQKAARLLEAADLPGANETLKTAEQVLILRRRIFDLSPW